MTAHYLHARWADRPALFRRLAAAVAPGGTLLVVGHLLAAGHGHGGGSGQLSEHDSEAFWTAEEIAALLDPGEWADVATGARERDPGAAERTGNAVPDTVLRARRSGAR